MRYRSFAPALMLLLCSLSDGPAAAQEIKTFSRPTLRMPGTQRGAAPALAKNLEANTNRPGNDYRSFILPAANPELCRQACVREAHRCRAFTYVKPGFLRPARCYLKRLASSRKSDSCCVSGLGSPAAPSRPLAKVQLPEAPKPSAKPASTPQESTGAREGIAPDPKDTAAAGSADGATGTQQAKPSGEGEIPIQSEGERLALMILDPTERPAGAKPEDFPEKRPETPECLVATHKEAFLAATKKRSYELTPEEARLILVFLHFADLMNLRRSYSQITPKVDKDCAITAPPTRGFVKMGAWVKVAARRGELKLETLASEPIESVKDKGFVLFVYNDGSKRLNRKQIKEGASYFDATARFSLAVYRLASYLARTFGVVDLHHKGVAHKTRYHVDGIAMDLSGFTGVDEEGKPFDYQVQQEWGYQPVEGESGSKPYFWPHRHNLSSYRLEKARLAGERPARLFWEAMRFMRAHFTRTGPAVMADGDRAVDKGVILYPDYSRSDKGGSSGREAHADHFHLQIDTK